MKKIMFNDHYGLTQAVLEGRKTMTRRIVPESVARCLEKLPYEVDVRFNPELQQFTFFRCSAGTKPEKHLWVANRFVRPCEKSTYNVGEEVAIAQSYETLANSRYCSELGMMDTPTTFKKEFCGKGWGNKMFVKAEYMPHRIRITDIKVERLQQISQDDVLKEGIREYANGQCYTFTNWKNKDGANSWSSSAHVAFKTLIDKVSGKGTWEKNPYVFVYSYVKY